MREVVCINVGQAGIQMANASWELFCIEHGVEASGKLKHAEVDETNGFHTFFEEVPSGNYVPRSINIDLEPAVIDEIRLASYRDLYHPDYLINCCEDAANNFARGHFTIGKTVIQRFMNSLRKCVFACDILQGFIVLNSYGGGTGSGLSSLIFEHLDIEFPKNPKFQQCIYPAPQMSTAIVEPYNAILSASMSMNHTDVTMLLDNEATFTICTKKLNILNPSYNNINKIIAQIFSAMTVSIRFGSSLNQDLAHLQTNLVPYPRIHYPVVNYAPIMNTHKASHENVTITEITRELFSPHNQLVKCDLRMGKYMSCCIQYRGLITPLQVNSAIYDIKQRANICFVDWCPTGFKLGISPMPPITTPNSEMAKSDKNCTMFCNTSAIVQLWQRLNKKFDLLYNKKAFVHWYVGEGMEEGEFVDARSDIHELENDYYDLLISSDDYQAKAQVSNAAEAQKDNSLFRNSLDINKMISRASMTPSTVETNSRHSRELQEIPETRESRDTLST